MGEWPECRQRGHPTAIKKFRQEMVGLGGRAAKKCMFQDVFWSVNPQDLLIDWMCGQEKAGLQDDS